MQNFKQKCTQELEYKRLGLPAFSDPTPWQRLSRDEQENFNKKYRALPPKLQEYSKLQFTTLPEDRQEHAYKMFLHLNIQTLSEVINRELERQNHAQNIFENATFSDTFEEVTFSSIQRESKRFEANSNIKELNSDKETQRNYLKDVVKDRFKSM